MKQKEGSQPHKHIALGAAQAPNSLSITRAKL